MTDIVERLEARRLALLDEAAAEIRRLREEIVIQEAKAGDIMRRWLARAETAEQRAATLEAALTMAERWIERNCVGASAFRAMIRAALADKAPSPAEGEQTP